MSWSIFFSFVVAHAAIIAPLAMWTFSAFMASMPELGPNTGFFTKWVHDFLQLLAANLNKRSSPPPPPKS
jgi:hypothetical protein